MRRLPMLSWRSAHMPLIKTASAFCILMISYIRISHKDHLDYHLTRVHYRYTKFKLRRYLKPQGNHCVQQ